MNTKSKNKTWIFSAALLLAHGAASTAAAGGAPPTDYCAPAVVDQIDGLAHHGEPMGFFRDAGFRDLEHDKHLQGVARYPGAGTPTLYVSRNGNPGWTGGSSEPGQIGVVSLPSRAGDGERLRSNRLDPDRFTFDRSSANLPVLGTPPPWSDRITYTIDLDGGDHPGYEHPGGMTLVDGVLVVGADHPLNEESSPAIVLFFDLDNPSKPVLAGQLPIAEGTAHAVAVARADAGDWLLLVLAGGDDHAVDVYKGSGETLLDAVPGLTYVDTWTPSRDGIVIGNDGWPTGHTAFQNLDVIHQCDGTQFLVGTHNTSSLGSGSDQVKVFRLDWDGGELHLLPENDKHLFCRPDGPIGAERQCNLIAAAGTYVTPSGELIVYSTEHDDDGPAGSVKAIEFRHQQVYSQVSAAREAIAVMNGPSEAGSGSLAVFHAYDSIAPVARPWFELFVDDNFGSGSIVYDWNDRSQESWNNLDAHEFYGEEVSSIRWEAPLGCQVELFSGTDFTGDSLVLDGTGSVASIADLESMEFGDRARSARMTGDCQEVTYEWQVDGVVQTGSGTLQLETGPLGVGSHLVELWVCFGSSCSWTVEVLEVTP